MNKNTGKKAESKSFFVIAFNLYEILYNELTISTLERSSIITLDPISPTIILSIQINFLMEN